MANKDEAIFLYVTGDDYASMIFEENCNPQQVYNEMYRDLATRRTIELTNNGYECYVEVEIFRFKGVDEEFEKFVKEYLITYPNDSNIYRVEGYSKDWQ